MVRSQRRTSHCLSLSLNIVMRAPHHSIDGTSPGKLGSASPLIVQTPGALSETHGCPIPFRIPERISQGHRDRSCPPVTHFGQLVCAGRGSRGWSRCYLSGARTAFGRLEGVSVSREEFLSRIWSHSTDLLEGAPAAVVGDFKWQFEECLGLISTSIDPDGPFHPLLHCPLHSVVVEGALSETVLLISLDQVVVALFCESRA